MTRESATIFLIDDDLSVRRAVGRLLRAEGYTVEMFASGSDFLRAGHDATEGCVLIDVSMPGMSGFEVAQSLANGRSTLPVILITGHGDVPMANRAMNIGCASFLAKPFEDETLLSAVRGALQRHRGDRDTQPA